MSPADAAAFNATALPKLAKPPRPDDVKETVRFSFRRAALQFQQFTWHDAPRIVRGLSASSS
jgi:hypothetical protein